MDKNLQQSIEKKLGCTIEERFNQLKAFWKEHPYECEVPRTNEPNLTWEEIRFIGKYEKEHNLKF